MLSLFGRRKEPQKEKEPLGELAPHVNPVKEYLESLLGRPLNKGEAFFMDWKCVCRIEDFELFYTLAKNAGVTLEIVSDSVFWYQDFPGGITSPHWDISIQGDEGRKFIRKYGAEFGLTT